jgi:uncharacterized protein YdhG (YjbR/CyaY superfamily)
MTDAPSTVEDYVGGYPDEVALVLRQVRRHIAAALPDAGERISYGMPTVTLGGRPLLYYGGWKQHLGLYPVPRYEGELEEAVAPYRSTKGTLRFRYRDPVPYDLITRIAIERARRP